MKTAVSPSAGSTIAAGSTETSSSRSAPEVMPFDFRKTAVSTRESLPPSATTIFIAYKSPGTMFVATAVGPRIAPLYSIGIGMFSVGNSKSPHSFVSTFPTKYSVFLNGLTSPIDIGAPEGSRAMLLVKGSNTPFSSA